MLFLQYVSVHCYGGGENDIDIRPNVYGLFIDAGRKNVYLVFHCCLSNLDE